MGATWALFLGLVLALLGGHGADASLAALSCGDNCEPGPDLLPRSFRMLTLWERSCAWAEGSLAVFFFQFAAL